MTKNARLLTGIFNRFDKKEPEMKTREWENRIVKPTRVMRNRQCAVLVPVVNIDGEYHLIFEVRSSDMTWQPGDICFPGGRIEIGDKSPKEAAVREMIEELGVTREQIHYLGPLDYVESLVGVTVWPFAALVDTTEFVLSKGEVAEVFTVPVSWFIHHEPEQADMEIATRPSSSFPQDVYQTTLAWRPRRTYDIFIYRYKNRIIWGITAHIIKGFIEEYKRIELNK